MSLKGGTVLFTDEIDETKKQELILKILNDDSTTIKNIKMDSMAGRDSTTGIFKIALSGEIFRENFKSEPPPNALLIKVFKRCKMNEVENEINIHQEINSKTNMMPIAPSILLNYPIVDNDKFTNLNLLCGEKLFINEVFCQLITLKNKDKKNTVANVILVMEFIECDTYDNFFSEFSQKVKKEVKADTHSFKILDMDIKLSLTELNIFFTYYLASVLAVKGYHHGDLHEGNVMICQKAPLEINPFLIDFGRAGTFDTLSFVELEQEYLKTLKLTIAGQETIISEKESIEGSFLILHQIYSMALENKDAIAEYVNTLLKEGNYVNAVLILNMCVNANLSEIKDSQFTYYMKNILGVKEKDEYTDEYTDDEPSPYEYLFNINDNMRTKFNEEIGKLIQRRKQLEEGKLNPVEGGKLVLRRQKNSKKRTYRRSKIHKKKSKKLNKLNKLNKNKLSKKKTKKSKKSKTK
jgi:hypothetical protein